MTTETFKRALKGQYHAALAMLRLPIEACPDELWNAGVPPRQFWRVAYHALYYSHLYLEQSTETHVPWPKERDNIAHFDDDEPLNPAPTSKADLLEYWQEIDDSVDAKVDALDLEAQESGFSWYKNFPKLDHQLVNLRHIQEHAGQLRDRMMEAGIDMDWVSRRHKE